MSVGNDERAVSELLGAILLFGLLVILLVLSQVLLVPTMNAGVEADHNARAQDDLRDLQDSMFRMGATGAPEQTFVEAGVSYPDRPLLVNPAPATGTVRTLDAGDLLIENVMPVDPEAADYWVGGPADAGVYSTRPIQYAPDYNEYRSPGTTYLEGSVLYTDFDGKRVVDGQQVPVVDGRRITLVTIDGEFFAAGAESVPVALRPTTGPARTVGVTDTGQPIAITLTTGLSAAEWTDLLEDEIDATGQPGNDRYVLGVSSAGQGKVTILLEAGETYTLRLSGVAVGDGAVRQGPAYLTRDTGVSTVVPLQGGEVFVEVRDRYNNPVPGATVNFEVNGTANLSTTQAVTDERGRAVTSLSASKGTTVSLRAYGNYDGGPVSAYEEVVFGVQVGDGGNGGDDDGDGGDDDNINPNRPDGNLVYVNASTGKNDNVAVANFQNTKTGSGVVTVTDVRINFFSANGAGSSDTTGAGGTAPIYAVLTPGNERLDVAGPFVELATPIDVADGDQVTLQFAFKDEGNDVKVIGGDFFVVTMLFEDGDRATYFINPIETSGGGGNTGGGNGNGNN